MKTESTKNCVSVARFALAAHLLLAAVICIPSGAVGQSANTGSVSGVVSNQYTREKLAGATIVLMRGGASRSVVAETGGFFSFPNVASGTYTLTISYPGLDSAARTVEVTPGHETHEAVALASEIYKMDVFTVAGEREGNARALTQQRGAENVKNVVASDAFGSLVEGNIGVLLQRLPGVGTQLVGGDIRTVFIRGVDPALNSVTVNGAPMPNPGGAGAVGRAFDFQNISADTFETVELIKAPTPDMDANSIGGAVNLISKSAFDQGERRIKATAGLSYNTTRTDQFRGNGSVNYSDLFGASRQFGVSVNAGFSQHIVPQDGTLQAYGGLATSPTYDYRVRIYDQIALRSRANGGIKVDYKKSANAVFGFNFLYNYYGETYLPQYRRQFLEATSATLAVRATNGTYSGGAILPDYTATITNIRPTTNSVSTLQVGRSWIDVRTWQLRFDGRQKFGRLALDYDGVFGEGRNVYKSGPGKGAGVLLMSVRNVGLTIDRSGDIYLPKVTQTAGPDVYAYENYTVDSYTEADRLTNDRNLRTHLNARYDCATVVPAFLKAGFSFSSQWKLTDYLGERAFTYVGPAARLADFRESGYDRSPSGAYRMPPWPDARKVAASVRSNPEWWREDLYQTTINNLRSDGRVTEDIAAAFVMGNVKLERLTILSGLRVEETSLTATAARRDPTARSVADPVARGIAEWGGKAHRRGDYRDVFPGVHFVYRAPSGLVGRASYTTSIGRPAFGTLLPVTNPDDISQVLTANNVGLKPQKSDNFDCAIEYYFEPVGQLSANFFLKELKDFIYSTRGGIVPAGPDNGFNGAYAGYELRSQANGGFARIRGFELSYQQQFSFLPGLLNGLGIFANYTKLETKGDYGSGPVQETAAIPNFIPESYNVGLYYRHRRFSGRLQWTHHGDFLMSYNADPVARTYRGVVEMLDLNLQFLVSRRLELYCNVNNLLNERTYNQYIYRPDRPLFTYRSGIRINSGASYRF